MIEAVRRAAPIVATGAVGIGFLLVGVLIGGRHPVVTIPVEPPCFVATNKPGYAFDTKLGLECDMDGVDVHPPPGLELDIPRCATLAKQ
jgi:hypothetical protein